MKKTAYLIACSLVIAGFFMGPTVHAASLGDTAWRQANTLNVAPSDSYSLPEVDITNDWATYIINNTNPANAEARSYFQNCLNSNTGSWSVTQMEQTSGRKDVIIYCSTNDNTTFDFNTSSNPKTIYLNTPSNGAMMFVIAYTLSTSFGCDSNVPCLISTNDQTPYPISSEGPMENGDNFYGGMINGNIQYPEFYAGATIPSSIGNQEALHPTFEYQVTGLKIALHNTTDLSDTTQCYWRIDNDPVEDPLAGYNATESSNCDDLEYTWTRTGTYYVALVIVKNGHTYQGDANLAIDGSTYSGQNGATKPKSPFVSAIESVTTNTHGLSNIVTAPLQFLAQLPNSVNNCTPITIPWGNLGTMTLPCMTPIYQAHINTLLITYQVVLVGVFTYYMGLSLFKKIKEVSSPSDDRIEVVNL